MATPQKDRIIAELDTLRQSDTVNGNKFQALAYAKVIAGLRALTTEVSSLEDIHDVPGIGVKIRAKIAEILKTGSLAAATQVRAAHAQPVQTAYDDFLKIHGVGPVKAKELVEFHKISTIEELRTKQDRVLNNVQRIGLKHYNDLLERIPRDEMNYHANFLYSALPVGAHGVVVGSYRRHTATSGDIDMLISVDAELTLQQQKAFLAGYVESLTKQKYVQDVLALGAKKCMAVVRMNQYARMRRLDLLITPKAEFFYSILYFTGSDQFNIAFRKHALTRGYTLNEHTATPVDNPSRMPFPPPMNSEEDIFAFFGLKYVAPEYRNGETDILPLVAPAASENRMDID